MKERQPLGISEFAQAVYQAAARIPAGRVARYSDIARIIGRPEAVRAVGNALHRNPFAPEVPCHRVVRADGGIGGFFSGGQQKARLLAREGVPVKQGKIAPEYFYEF